MSAVPLESPRDDMPPLSGELLLGVPPEVYYERELGVASASTLKLIRDRSPAHYRAWVDGKDEADTPAMAFGRAYHCRVLEPAAFAERYVVAPDFGDMRSSTNRAKRDAWRKENPGATGISQETAERIEAMHAALMKHPVAAGLMREGESEVTLRWVDEVTGVKCKARADWWVRAKRLFMDLKTTDDASPAGFARSIAKYGYHVQHAHYCDGARACGVPVRHYLIVAQEKEAPYAVGIYHIDAAAEARGFELREQGLQTMRACLDADSWPGYGTGITQISLPPWALKD